MQIGNTVGTMNDIEYIFCSVVIVVGACFMAVVIGNMALLVSNMNVTAARHRVKMDMMTDAVRYLGMPKRIQERVQEYFDYLSTFSHPGACPPGLPAAHRIVGEAATMTPLIVQQDPKA